MVIVFRDCDENGKNGKFLGIFAGAELAKQRCIGYKNVYYREIYTTDVIYEDDPLQKLYSKPVTVRTFPKMWTKKFKKLPDDLESFKKATFFKFTSRSELFHFFCSNGEIEIQNKKILANLTFAVRDYYLFFYHNKNFYLLPDDFIKILKD